MFKKSWHNYSVDQDTETVQSSNPTSATSFSRGASRANLNYDSNTEDGGRSDEELRQLKGSGTDEEEEQEEFLLEEYATKSRRGTYRGSQSLSRKNTLLSIGFNTTSGPAAPLSSDAESSEESQPGGADWAEKQSSSPELPQEYWQVQRLVKYIKFNEDQEVSTGWTLKILAALQLL